MKNSDDRPWNDEEDDDADGMSLDDQECDADGDDLREGDVDVDPTWLDAQMYDTDGDAQPVEEENPPHSREADPRWRITAVGKRPKDYMIRDLIFGSLLRIPGPARLHRRIRWYRSDSPPPCVLRELGHLSDRDRHVAIPLLAFMQEWKSFLDFFVDPEITEEDEALNSIGLPTPRSLRACWPVGALVKWAGKGKAPKRKTCGHRWACPWCYARHTPQLYYRLRRGPLWQPRQGQYLVQANVSLTPEMIGVDPDWCQQELRRPQFDSGTPWWAEGPVPNFHRFLRKEVMDQQRLLLSVYLRRFVTDLGMNDGLLTHRVVPALTSDGQHSYRHEFTALGTVELSTPQAMAEFRAKAGIDGGGVEYQTQEGNKRRITAQVLVAAMPADYPQAPPVFPVRHFPAGYPIDRLPLIAREDALLKRPCRWLVNGHFSDGPWLHNGLPGSFAATPLFLFDPLQWRCYLARTAGLPLYKAFGSWRPSAKDPIRGGTHARTNGRIPKLRQMALSVWPAVKAQAQTGARGRPAYGSVLRAALSTKGIELSRREMTEILGWLCTKH